MLGVNNLTYASDWLVSVIVDGTTVGYLSYANVSTNGAIAGLNYTSYAYYYFDYSRNSGWPGPYNTSNAYTIWWSYPCFSGKFGWSRDF